MGPPAPLAVRLRPWALLVLSAKAQASDRRDGLDAGADDYLTKPFEPLELVERVTALLERPGR